jgi:hypothetical protein
VAPAEASPAAGLELQPLLGCSSNSSSPPQRLPPARAGPDWLSDDDDSEASVQLLPPAAPLTASWGIVPPEDSGDSNAPVIAAAADSLQTLHEPPLAMLAAEPGASHSKAVVSAAAVTESSAGADSFAVVASESAAMLCMTDGSPAAHDALPVAAPMEVTMRADPSQCCIGCLIQASTCSMHREQCRLALELCCEVFSQLRPETQYVMQDALARTASALRPGFIQDDAQYISCYVTSLVQGFCTPRQPQQLLPGADALGEHDHSSAP